MSISAVLRAGLIVLSITAETLMANYAFLGNVQKYQMSDSGIRLYCEDGYQLNIEFLLPNMFRVFLLRPQYQEVPLTYPIAKDDWAAVALDFEETEGAFVLKTAALELRIRKNPCRLQVLNREGMVINEDEPAFGIGWDGKEIRNWKKISRDEKFFGLGEKTGNLDKRGRQWVLWNTDDPHFNNRTDPVYQSIPFFVGMRAFKAYGVYFNNSYRSRFDFGASNDRYWSFSAEAGNLDYFFIYGPEVSKVVETYTELTGRTPMPPRWSLGYQQCRWSYYPDTEVLRIAETFRDKQIPADVIYLDIHYMDGYRVFTWDKQRFPDPAGLLEKLKQLGFKVVVIIDPGVKVDPEYEIASSGLAGDHFVKYPDGKLYVGEVWPGKSYFPDFSRSETRAWWGSQFEKLLDVGVDGFWNDMNEPAVWGKAFPDEVLFDDRGAISNHKKMHNLYGFLMAETCYDGLKKLRPNERPFVITRAGFAGEQRFTSVWTGDNHATEEHLALGIRMLQGLGVSGVPFVGTDIGGFQGTPSPELYARWLQAALFAPFFRTHTHYGSMDQEPWSFGEKVEEISRKFITKRYEYLPYLYSLFWQAHQTGAPILRPMFWHDQDDERVYDPAFQEQFYVGEKLLVAPVTRVGHTLRKIYLPAGKWLDLATEELREGPASIVVDAPLDRLPMFLREGGILPRREPVQFVDEKPMDKLILDIFPAAAGSYKLYEDDGASFDYERGKYRLTVFGLRVESDEILLAKHRTHDRYEQANRSIVARMHGIKERPVAVELDGTKLAASKNYTYDEKSKVLTVEFEDTDRQQNIRIAL